MARATAPFSNDQLKARQAEYYDHGVEDPEFEINRPHGESRLYRYAMDFKFKKVMKLLGRSIAGCDVLAICCGSGMDAEYLVSEGARVVALDLSEGCLRRARLRSERFGVRYELVQGDAEDLPFSNRSFDYVFVHDGLHHLVAHEVAIREMARVARRGLLISEPAVAAVTSIPTALHLINASEEAGNAVNRIDARRFSSLLRSMGFQRVVSSRYLLKYGHPPSRWWRRLDNPILFAAARVAFRGVGATLLAPWGNKLVVVAERGSESVSATDPQPSV